MTRFILLTFGFLGWSFYELSGGADYEPLTERDPIFAPSVARSAPDLTALSPTVSTRQSDVPAVVQQVALDADVAKRPGDSGFLARPVLLNESRWARAAWPRTLSVSDRKPLVARLAANLHLMRDHPVVSARLREAPDSQTVRHDFPGSPSAP